MIQPWTSVPLLRIPGGMDAQGHPHYCGGMPKIPSGQPEPARVTFCETCGRETPWQSGRCVACGAKRNTGAPQGLSASLNEIERLRWLASGADPGMAEVRRVARRALWAWDRFSVSLVILLLLGIVLGVALHDTVVMGSVCGFALTMSMIREAIISALRARDREARVLRVAEEARAKPRV